MNFLLRFKPLRRHFERRFAALEASLAVANRESNHAVPPPDVAWAETPVCTDIRQFYSFHDRTCPDVRAMPTETWWRSHFDGRYPLHDSDHARVDFTWETLPDGLRFRSSPRPDRWICLTSRALLPETYSISFAYLPRNVFKEQLQLDFAATSLADRHRYILSFNEKLRYQRIERGFWLPDVAQSPWSVPIGRPTRIRLDVVGATFALWADGEPVACWRDDRYCPHPSRNMLISWNGDAESAMDFDVTDFAVRFPACGRFRAGEGEN